jgi:hypothetical protein
MKIRLILTTTTLIGAFFFTACSTTAPEYDDAVAASYQHIQKELTLKQMHDKILQAGEANGWRMTEYKENEILAEKFDGDHSKAVSVKFTTNSFTTSPKDAQLEDAIKEALQK